MCIVFQQRSRAPFSIGFCQRVWILLALLLTDFMRIASSSICASQYMRVRKRWLRCFQISVKLLVMPSAQLSIWLHCATGPMGYHLAEEGLPFNYSSFLLTMDTCRHLNSIQCTLIWPVSCHTHKFEVCIFGKNAITWKVKAAASLLHCIMATHQGLFWLLSPRPREMSTPDLEERSTHCRRQIVPAKYVYGR